jgi:septal ring factor EnvC (AmiA/AmiB activator)
MHLQLQQAQDQEQALAKIEKKLSAEAESLRSLQAQLLEGQDHLQQLFSESNLVLPQYSAQLKALGLQLLRQQHSIFSPLQLLVSMDDPRKISRKINYYRYLNAARKEYCASLAQTLSTLESQQHDIAQQQILLTQVKLKSSESLAKLQHEKNKRSKLLRRLKKNLAQKGRSLEHLQQESQQLESFVKGLQVLLPEQAVDIPLRSSSKTMPKRAPSFALLQQKLPKPLQAPFTILKDRLASFRGIILAAPEGSEVKAVYPGTVIFADWIRGFGLLTILDHGQGYMTLYGHLQTVYKKLGEHIEPNEILARVGQSGGQDQPGLYFEIRKDGEALDPLAWLKP